MTPAERNFRKMMGEIENDGKILDFSSAKRKKKTSFKKPISIILVLFILWNSFAIYTWIAPHFTKSGNTFNLFNTTVGGSNNILANVGMNKEHNAISDYFNVLKIVNEEFTLVTKKVYDRASFADKYSVEGKNNNLKRLDILNKELNESGFAEFRLNDIYVKNITIVKEMLLSVNTYEALKALSEKYAANSNEINGATKEFLDINKIKYEVNVDGAITYYLEQNQNWNAKGKSSMGLGGDSETFFKDHIMEEVLPKQIRFKNESEEISIGDSLELSYDIIPEDSDNKSVQWMSSNEHIALVNSEGVVTGLSEGNTKISVTTYNGNTSECIINVVKEKAVNKEVSYKWEYPTGVRTWQYKLQIPIETVKHYKSIDRNDIEGFSYFVTHEDDDEYLGELANIFRDIGIIEKLSERETINLVVSFVQSLKYVADDVGTGYDDYPKFPLETLYDEGGDCEDSSILLASLLRELNYGTVLVLFHDHMGVGVISTEPGNFKYEGNHYQYIETTNTGWAIGQLPTEYKRTQITVLPVNK